MTRFSAALGKIKTSFAFAIVCTKIEMFRPVLEAELLNHDKKNVGAKPIDILLTGVKLLMPVLWMFPAKEIRRKKTQKSSQAMAMNCGMSTLTKNVRKTLTHVGLKKANNRIKLGTRSRVEHIFGFVTNSMHDFFSRCIGFKRIRGVIGLTNLFYNMFRYEQIVRLQLQPVRAN